MIPERARGWLEAALNEHKRPLYTMSDVEAAIERGSAFLKVGAHSCVLIGVADEGGAGERIADVWLAGGDMEEIASAVPALEAWACAMGCTQVVLNGRKGWVRVLAPQGYEYLSTSVRKLLT